MSTLREPGSADSEHAEPPSDPTSSRGTGVPLGWLWPLVGLSAGLLGLGVAYLAAELLHLRLSPTGAVGELVIRLTPGQVVESGIQAVGTNDKPLLLLGIWVFLLLAFAAIGLAARRWWAAPVVGFGLLAAVGLVAYLTAPGSGGVSQVVPVVAGFVTWTVPASKLADRLRAVEPLAAVATGPGATSADVAALSGSRRGFLGMAALLAGAGAVAGVLGRLTGRSRQLAEQARSQLKLPVTAPVVPAGVALDVDGISPWQTPAEKFYRVDTTFYSTPSIQPKDWSLRIHGMVDNEITLSFDDLTSRDLVENWVTLNCVSNPVGGQYIGNAWWSGVRLDAILKMAGPQAGADAVMQTSDDGWTCGTPLAALTDGRPAMLAVAMNGEPLPIEHGFPVRTIVPGLYGYVSACKWVRSMEVTRFTDFSAYWTQRGWGEKGPVKIASRIDVPRNNATVASGDVVVAGVAWDQDLGISGVQVALDGGAWVDAVLAEAANIDSWVQWRATVPAASGTHQVRVRAIDANGNPQTGVRLGVLPDGATGWDQVQFTAS